VTIGHVLMGLLASSGRHGYDLKKDHDDRFPDSRPLAFGQVYATLDRLLKKGFVRAREIERVDGPDRTVYELTASGRDDLERWLGEVEEPAPFVSNPLAVKATIALMVSNQTAAQQYLRRQREAHLARMRHYTTIKIQVDAPISKVLAADYAIAHLDADLRWLDTALERINALAQEVRT
jgi:DNA-binding PadR family transcriptional regulator